MVNPISIHEHALACFYESLELKHQIKSFPNDDRELCRDAGVGGGIFVGSMFPDDDAVADLLSLDDLDEALIRLCADTHGHERDTSDRHDRCAAAVAGAVAFMMWWANTLLGLHDDVLCGASIPSVTEVLPRVAALEAARPQMLRRCIAAADGGAEISDYCSGRIEITEFAIKAHEPCKRT